MTRWTFAEVAVFAAGVATLAKEFRYGARDPIVGTNTMLIASDSPISAASMERAPLHSDLEPLAHSQTVEPALRGGEVFTDDRAPVEWLIDTSIVRYAAGESSG